MRYVPDKTGRFSQRPHFKPQELDRECESIIATFLKERRGDVSYPISTDELTVLIERDTESLDQFADLSAYGPNVEGLTLFQPGRKPQVKISARLAEDERRQNRLRTTLAHEYGHVRFHAILWDMEPPSADLLRRKPTANMQICYRDTMLDAVQTDWMEWQAGYACGAFLMPATALRQLIRSYLERHGLFGVVGERDPHGQDLIEIVKGGFEVSGDAARIRLIKLGILGPTGAGPSLFNL
ncbi:ImmA/IrrE family metallo-endopeptidase [Bradyrhizobium sp. TM239]|uniref:ImmA/IrrE family metallo-endopeptidase n=1 Tax=Bradyrhizobium sp. TM239 TaxID=2599802 RepID=UPI0027D645F2|nr:ImmA/IrrE family metallo-endopeptidase [Bradyrhizobium sp. TM239]